MHVNRVRRQITADNVLRELEQSTSDRQKSLLPRCISPRTPPSGTLVVLVLLCFFAESPRLWGDVRKGVVTLLIADEVVRVIVMGKCNRRLCRFMT